MHQGFVIACKLLKTSCDISIVFQPGKKIFNKMAHFVEEGAEFMIGLLAVGIARNDGIYAFHADLLLETRMISF